MRRKRTALGIQSGSGSPRTCPGVSLARILIIDDSPSLIAAIRETLEAYGFEVDSLSTFLDLPDKFRRKPPDLVLLDLEMPMMPGKMAAEYIRKYEPTPTPILIHSSLPRPRMEEVAAATGAVGCLSKGLPAADLVATIRTHLRKR